MMDKIREYVDDVVSYVYASEAIKERISKDLYLHITEACSRSSLESVLLNMGSPQEVANEFMEGIYEDKKEIAAQMYRENNVPDTSIDYYEYKSPYTFLGLPLVHIKARRRHSSRLAPSTAKGIFAMGDIAIGVFSFGGLSLGLFSLGGLSIGLISLGGIAVSALLSIGGLAVGGALAIGGIAIGYGGMGGLALGKIAVGGLARGHVAIGGNASGQFVISGEAPDYVLNHVSKEEVYQLIQSAYPNLSRWMIRIFTLPFS